MRTIINSLNVTNKPELDSFYILLYVAAPPSVDVSTPSLLEVKKGDDVTLNCRASGKPAPVVKWARVGKLMPDGSSEIESEVVTFSNVNRKHAGTYRCTADNGHGREASKTVEVAVEYRCGGFLKEAQFILSLLLFPQA